MRHEIFDNVRIPIAENYRDCINLIRSDYHRWYGRSDANIARMWAARWRNPAFGFMFYYRLCKYKGILYPYLRLRLEKYTRKYALQIPLSVKIGYGLYLGHGTGIISNSNAIIGNNVNLSQFTTIGSVKGHAATIEDNCYIGPSVCMVEHVRLGAGCVIGAGAVVTSDIPSTSVAAGVPARIIKESGSYTPANKYPLPL